jgi:ABC-type hemin transport system ATPase subunit
LLDRFEAGGRRGAIIGGHGSGKSTLLAEMIRAFRRQDRPVLLIELRDRQRWLPRRWVARARAQANTLVVVDGYEQLGFPSRLHLQWRCCWHRWGLLVTAHAQVGLPELYHTSISPDVAQRIVQYLAGTSDAIDSRQLAEVLARHHGDMREALFELYDRYEARQRV